MGPGIARNQHPNQLVDGIGDVGGEKTSGPRSPNALAGQHFTAAAAAIKAGDLPSAEAELRAGWPDAFAASRRRSTDILGGSASAAVQVRGCAQRL